LVQAGILTRTISGSRTFSPFLEYIEVGTKCCAAIDGSFNVSSGDEVEVEVYWTSDTNTCFFVYDRTTGAYPVDSCLTVADYGVPHDTSSAEWLMEDAIPQQKCRYLLRRQLSWGAPGAPVMPVAPITPGTPVMPVAPVAPLALSAGSYTQTRSRPVFFAR
jgi:hypothetical protein